jgi:hypothetical protein
MQIIHIDFKTSLFQETRHDFCCFVVSNQLSGRATFVRMSKIDRQVENTTERLLTIVKVHFVSSIHPGSFNILLKQDFEFLIDY